MWGSSVSVLVYIFVNLPQFLSESDSYLYADDKCIFYQDKDTQNLKFSEGLSVKYVRSEGEGWSS